MEDVRNVFKMSELNKSVKEWACRESFRVLRGADIESVEKE